MRSSFNRVLGAVFLFFLLASGAPDARRKKRKTAPKTLLNEERIYRLFHGLYPDEFHPVLPLLNILRVALRKNTPLEAEFRGLPHPLPGLSNSPHLSGKPYLSEHTRLPA